MFHVFQNTAEIRFVLRPDGPILVRAQSVGIDPVGADMEFHRTRRGGESTVFLAGSGLKGVLRAHCERLLRSSGVFACDPTKVGNKACCADPGHKMKAPTAERPHAGVCPACFTFGSLKMAGRFHVDDAFPLETESEDTNHTEVRAGVGIDRKSHGASTGALFDTEVVVSGGFEVRVRGENFPLWQLGLLLAALDHLNAGLVRIGGNKARGMGRVRIEDRRVSLRFLDNQDGQLSGARKPASAQFNYNLPENEALPIPPGGTENRQGLFRAVTFEGAGVQTLTNELTGAQSPLTTYLAHRIATMQSVQASA